ncbi:glycosyl transferase [candidate division WOR-3 bacterium]|uniref:Glycosyl transferase n=1 Tax=candidate division WOR-3 bacterium TaxID=2052148 RepID=A0A660SJK3_UNCW3|nr:MAG: glycosyl transferase [candidate division WOR-3 bacterium]
MADFFQNGMITTLHRIGEPKLETIEAELLEYSRTKPLTILIPCLVTEFRGRALPLIRETIKKLKYVDKLVITLDLADRAGFNHAKRFFGDMPQKVRIIWIDGKRVSRLLKILKLNDLDPGPRGKGRAVWFGVGYILARGKEQAIVVHDADIINYDRWLVARLVYPVLNPSLNYEFCKSYYARVTDRLYGRVTRLFFTPLLRTFKRIFPGMKILEYLDSFRYPLSGELSFTTELAPHLMVPADWGLELGLLVQVFYTVSLDRICQTDIADRFDHKHQSLIRSKPHQGLMRMAIDITKTFFRTLSEEGVVFHSGFFKTLRLSYIRIAKSFVKKYNDLAKINQLRFDLHREMTAVESFARALEIAYDEFIRSPVGVPLTPSWHRVFAAIPEFFDLLNQAVEEDNK